MGDEALEADGMEGDAAELGAPRTDDGLLFGVRMDEIVVAGGAHEFGGGLRGAAGRVDLQVVVEFDNFCVFEEGRGLAGEMHHEDRANCKVRCEHGADLAGFGFLCEPRHEFVVEAGGPDDHADAFGHAGIGKDRGPGGVREIDDDVGSQLVAGGGGIAEEREALEDARLCEAIDVADGSHSVFGEDGGRDLAAHAARTGNQDTDISHRAAL
jgi:hypothetical protein